MPVCCEVFMKLTLLFPMTLLIFTTTAYAQSVSDCKHRILLLPQTHPTILGGSRQVLPENFDQTVRSQFSIAKYLEHHKNLPVFSEQVSRDQTVQTVSPDFRQFAAQTKSMFPSGLPQDFNDLTDEQKNVIAQSGGDAISFILRNTDMLHRVVENDQVQNQLIDKVSDWAQKNPYATIAPPEIVNIIFNVRENLALDQINNYIKANPSQQDIVLIYGSDHYYSFRTHSDKFPAQCILVPYEFQSAITSPYDQNRPGPNGYDSFSNGNHGPTPGAVR
jgi:hypothetical protein